MRNSIKPYLQAIRKDSSQRLRIGYKEKVPCKFKISNMLTGVRASDITSKKEIYIMPELQIVSLGVTRVHKRLFLFEQKL